MGRREKTDKKCAVSGCAGKCIYDKKKRKTAAGEPPGKGNLYEDKKCKIRPV
nr:MAG TPA: hypothetical protein [Caudoviricetes sp.]